MSTVSIAIIFSVYNVLPLSPITSIHGLLTCVCSFVLDGYPLSRQQVELMTKRNILPVRVLELQLPGMEIVTRATKDRYSPDRSLPLHDSAQIVTVKMAAWQKEVK